MNVQGHYISPFLAKEEKLLVYASTAKLYWTARLLVLFLGLISLLSPVVALDFVEGRAGRLCIVCIAVTLFALIVAMATNARSLEVLAATAA